MPVNYPHRLGINIRTRLEKEVVSAGNTMLLSNSHLQWGDRHTYFEVQLTAPGVNSSGAVWVGFPVLR